MRATCPVCDDEKYHDLCPKCGNCVEHCVCARVAQTARVGGLRCPEPATLCGSVVWAYDPKKLIQEPPAPKGIVLIEHLNRERRWVTRCDACCHESSGGPCACLCSGAFHGIQEGSERWKGLILDLGPSLVARYKNIGVDVSGLEAEIQKLEVRSE